MSTLFVSAAKLDKIIGLLQPAPSITQWQRLESDPVELDLAAGLEARLADPLWLIGRQWQFAELKGEDAGMPVLVSLEGEQGRLTMEGVADDPDALPEAQIEAEPAREALASIAVDASIDLRDALANSDADDAFDGFCAAFPLELAPQSGDLAGRDLAALLGAFALDAPALASALEQLRGADGLLAELPAQIAVPAALRNKALGAAQAWLDDWRSLLVDLEGEPRWKPKRLEYSTRMSAATADGAVPLQVPEYANGRFDWWAMDVAGAPDGSPATVRKIEAARIPTAIRFPGMAADRLFEVEPEAVGVLGATTGPTGLLAMLLIEYAVAASNDWYQVPLTLSYGTAFRVGKLTVRDSFNIETTVPPSAGGSAHWSMFVATTKRFADPAAPLFLFPAATAYTMEGDPIEEVVFFRDELANLAWAVERQLPGLTPTAFRPPFEIGAGQALQHPDALDAALIYRLQTPMPSNWYPLAPEVQADGAVGLRLRPLKRFGPEGEHEDRPTASVLHAPGGEALLIEEREIPRSGLVVTRSFQLARDSAGRRLLWLGRRKKVGRGEGSSGIQFDFLQPSED